MSVAPSIRHWELNETSSRYDHIVAAPSDDLLVIFWTVWSVIASSVTIFTLVVFFGIVLDKNARSRSFNLYLVFLMIPDITFSLLCAITCGLNSATGSYHSAWMCKFQSWYSIFGFACSLWLNAVIARQIHIMLRSSHDRKRYFPPSHKTVYLHVAVVYLWSAFVGSWTLLGTWIPTKAFPLRGLACLPAEYDLASTLFMWLAFIPSILLLPLSYVLFVCWDIYRNKLLPRSGKTRNLAIYFFRLLIVLLAMWLPAQILIFLVVRQDPWVGWIGGTISHLQGLVSAAISLTKPDVWKATVKLITCSACRRKEVDDASELQSRQGFAGAVWPDSRMSSEVAGRSTSSNDSVQAEICVEAEAEDIESVE